MCYSVFFRICFIMSVLIALDQCSQGAGGRSGVLFLLKVSGNVEGQCHLWLRDADFFYVTVKVL